jgi:hypothetical protein
MRHEASSRRRSAASSIGSGLATYLVYGLDDGLFGAPFDAGSQRMTAPPMPLVDHVAMAAGVGSGGHVQFAVSRDGTGRWSTCRRPGVRRLPSHSDDDRVRSVRPGALVRTPDDLFDKEYYRSPVPSSMSDRSSADGRFLMLSSDEAPAGGGPARATAGRSVVVQHWLAELDARLRKQSDQPPATSLPPLVVNEAT